MSTELEGTPDGKRPLAEVMQHLHAIDVQALAAAIAEFQREFPLMTWSISNGGGGSCVFSDFDLAASSYARCPATALRECGNQLREKAERSRIAAEHAALMDAEYGPELERR